MQDAQITKSLASSSTLAYWEILDGFLSSAEFLSKINLFLKISFWNTIRECQPVWILIRANIFVGHDLGPNCLQRLSVEDANR